MSELTNNDISEITRQSDLTSKPVRDNFTNIRLAVNDNQTQINNLSSAATNAETTQARPNHSSLNDRLNSINEGQYNYVKTGGEVTASAPAAMTVEIAAGEANVGGIDVKWSAVTSETITAPVALSTGDTTYQMYVVAVESAQTTGGSFINLLAGPIDTDKILPAVSNNQKALAILEITATTATITASEISDARDQGCYYFKEGAYTYNWKIQDAVLDLATIGGQIFVGRGSYYEEVDFSGISSVALNYEVGAKHYRSNDDTYCIKSVNSAGNEESRIIIFNGDFYGDSRYGAIELLKFDYTDDAVIENCRFDGNANSTATYKNAIIENSDRIRFYKNILLDGSGAQDTSTYDIDSNSADPFDDNRFLLFSIVF
jgi:hypothetical protein